ncbi:MAG TPA: terminase small subunit [Rhizobium sp.]
MPVLKNARYEQFAQGLARGLSATEAYAQAGYKESRSAASRLSTNVNIKRRIEEINVRVAEKAEWSAADRIAALKRISDASEALDPRVSVSAIAEANKMSGSYPPTRQEHTGRNGGPIEYANLTEEEIDARIAAIGATAGETGPDAEA